MHLTKFNWADEERQIVKVIHLINGKTVSTFMINLNENTIETIDIVQELMAQNNPRIATEQRDFSILIQNAKQWAKRQNPYPKNIRWYEEKMVFETFHESHEWVSSGIYNEIGNVYDGYCTMDWKLAYVLVYELTRLNTLVVSPKYKIFTYEDYISTKQTQYRVWVEHIPV